MRSPCIPNARESGDGMNRCQLCPGINPVIQADGPSSSPYLFIMESPTIQDSKKGHVLCGRPGEEVNRHYLPLAGLRRESVYITYAVQCLAAGPKGKLDPNRAQDMNLLQSCAECHLYPEIEELQPKLLIPMGALACKSLDPTINLDLHHGIPRATAFGMSFPMFNPNLGVFEPKRMLHIRTDWIKLKRYLAGKLYIPVDEFKGREEYLHLTHPAQIHDLLGGHWDEPHAADTEITHSRDPFCMSFSVTPGTGYVIRADDKPTLSAYQSHLDQWKGPILFHNWLFDSPVTEAMGLKYPRKKIVDTMVRAFHLGNLPQGLKALSYRELGMQMQDFDDLVRPYSTEKVLKYYREAYNIEWPKPEEQLVRDADGKWKLYKPQAMGTKLKRFFTDFTKNPEKDPFSMWSDNWADSHEMIEEQMGPWPGLCITHAPWDKVIHYSARDADSLLRLWPILEHMRRQVRKRPQERWRD